MRSFYLCMFSNMSRIGDESILDKLFLIYLMRNVNIGHVGTTESNSCLGFSYSYTAKEPVDGLITTSLIHLRGQAYKLSFLLLYEFYILRLHPPAQTAKTVTDSAATQNFCSAQDVSTNLPKPLLRLRGHFRTVVQSRCQYSCEARPQFPRQAIPHTPNLRHRQPSIRAADRRY